MKGTWATATQSFGDLFIWKQRLVVTENGRATTEWRSPEKLRFPRALLCQLSCRDWAIFIISLSAWIISSFDLHGVVIQTTKLAKHFGETEDTISDSVDLTLLLRPVGAIVFGLIGDKLGRKWPIAINLFVLGVLEIGTLISTSFTQFIIIRFLFGILIGGVYGNATSMALENCPLVVRGLMSGIVQQGFSTGFVVAACINLIVGEDTGPWETIFWIGAGFSIGVAALQMIAPESSLYVKPKGDDNQKTHPYHSRRILGIAKDAFIREWRLFLYCTVLMALFNYCHNFSHDSYKAFVMTRKGLDEADASHTSIITRIGGCLGGGASGYLSQWLGRRRAIILMVFMGSILIPAWILPDERIGLSISGCLMQFFLQGAWGVIPIHLSELSRPGLRSTFVGITSQLGAVIASPAARIIRSIAERHRTTKPDGYDVLAYGPAMALATAAVAISIIVVTAVGPENRGCSFGDDVAFVERATSIQGQEIDDDPLSEKQVADVDAIGPLPNVP
ncbi:carboxylic acid transport protein [Paecilomyces variotii No. 5]|uniref:Carboxylic acid transport protein n=1 Tax=Byssochlamys spectabilis (strain No. 5 / NBRC 109023) TaxID=1356009 RepID=V5FXR5_BYSSN|nr:carboxylic acid transport protein [Paecilomyces variotii No. 5]